MSISIAKLMSTSAEHCAPETDLAAAAMMMWRADCGIVPVVEPESNRLVGVIRPSDSPRNALARMAEHAVRRLPVVDEEGRLAGMLSIADLIDATVARDHASRIPASDVISTLRSICRRPWSEGSVPQGIAPQAGSEASPKEKKVGS
jgi:CBS domain-containing protein